jgi:5'-nucleotidase/UDP-sugar diphosphatase
MSIPRQFEPHEIPSRPGVPVWRAALRIGTALAVLAFGLPLPAATLTVLHVGDTHSHIDPFGPKDAGLKGTLGGLAKAAAAINATRVAEPNLLVTHAGDVFHGTFLFNAFFGVPELQIMRDIGFDAMAVGNHEFDYGPDILVQTLTSAYGTETLPLLSSNLDLSGKPELGTWIRPSRLKTVGGVVVGIFGMTTPGNPLNRPDPVQILGSGDPAVLRQIAGDQAAALRDAGAEIVILLSHLGLSADRDIATLVPGIDVILGGHDHLLFDEPLAVANPSGGQTLIVQGGAFYRHLVRLRLSWDAGVLTLVDYAAIPMDETSPSDAAVQAVVDARKADVVADYGDVYGTPLATAARDVGAAWNPASPARDTGMGNLLTAALRWKTGTDIALTANGLISEGLFAGPLVGDDLFRPVSFGYDPPSGLGFKIATFTISGTELLRAIESSLAYIEQSPDYGLQTAGLEYAYNPGRAIGQRVVSGSIRVNGQQMSLFGSYTVTVNEGIAMLIPVMGVQVSNFQLRPDLEYIVLRDYVVSLGTVDVGSDGHLRDASVPVPGSGGGGGGGGCFTAAGGAGPGPGIVAAVALALLVLGGRFGGVVSRRKNGRRFRPPRCS